LEIPYPFGILQILKVVLLPLVAVDIFLLFFFGCWFVVVVIFLFLVVAVFLLL
jgi:hypothetical protein